MRMPPSRDARGKEGHEGRAACRAYFATLRHDATRRAALLREEIYAASDIMTRYAQSAMMRMMTKMRR